MRLHDCLTRAARIWPDRPATFYRNRVQTWRSVCEETARLAAGLRSLGVSAGDRIALLGGNSDRYLGGFFAASWSGAALVPLNTRLAENELTTCLRDSGAGLLLAGDGFTAITERLCAAVPDLRGAVYIGDEPPPVRGHEKVPVCGQVVVPAGGQLKVPIPRSSCRPGS